MENKPSKKGALKGNIYFKMENQLDNLDLTKLFSTEPIIARKKHLTKAPIVVDFKKKKKGNELI